MRDQIYSPAERHVVAEMLREVADVWDSDATYDEAVEATFRIGAAGYGMLGQEETFKTGVIAAIKATTEDG